MVGSALKNLASSQGHEVFGKSSSELDFRERYLTFSELGKIKPDCIIIAAAKVGGIGANIENPVKFLSQNLQISINLIDAAFEAQVPKLIYVASSCMYPKNSLEPINEDQLLTGKFEETNEPYSVAKMASLKLVETYARQYSLNWSTVIPTNLYGPRDNFNEKESHVLPSLLARIHSAKARKLPFVEIWGDGTPRREFLFVEDMARALMKILNSNLESQSINIGSGSETTISELVIKLVDLIGYDGQIIYDNKKPKGIQSKFLDSTKVRALGWSPEVGLDEGLMRTYDWYKTSKTGAVK